MMKPGEVEVHTKPHGLPRPKPEAGNLTQVSRGERETEMKAAMKKFLADAPTSAAPTPERSDHPVAEPSPPRAVSSASDRVYAVISYGDGRDQRRYEMRKSVIVIRCGDQAGNADLYLKTPPELFSGEL
jgi:hypothetical protein